MDPIFTQQFQMPAPKSGGGGMFGSGGANWQNALMAALAGFMARRNPQVSSTIIGNLQDAQQLKERAKLAEQERQRQLQDQIALYDYKRANPDTAGTEFERGLSAIGVAPGTPEYNEHWSKRLNAIENPPYFYTDPTTGATMMIPRTQAAPQPAPPNVTFTPIDGGGPSPGGSGGFLRPF